MVGPYNLLPDRAFGLTGIGDMTEDSKPGNDPQNPNSKRYSVTGSCGVNTIDLEAARLLEISCVLCLNMS